MSRAGLVAALLAGWLPGCGDSGVERPPEVSRPARDDAAAAARPAASAIAPDWLVRLAHEPVVTMFRTAGPVVVGDRVVVGSTALGFAAVDATTGELAWRLPGEEFPYRIARHPTDAALLQLTGRCSHVPAGEPGRTCTQDVTLSDGRVTGQRQGTVHGEEEQTIERASVLLRDLHSYATVHDQRLKLASMHDRSVASVAGRFVEKAGAVGQPDPASRQVVALQLQPEVEAGSGPVIRPVWIEFDTGAITMTGAGTSGDGVVAADIAADGVAAVVRFGRELRRHQVVLWGPDGALRWRWDLPEPQQARVDVSVAVGTDAVFVFYDGRDLARLPLRSPTPDAGPGDAAGPVLENPTP